jgi:hypothetical protein
MSGRNQIGKGKIIVLTHAHTTIKVRAKRTGRNRTESAGKTLLDEGAATRENFPLLQAHRPAA